MKDYGKVSIITPSWNCGKYVEDTIRSIQAQTYGNWEVLFQDDCSTDNTLQVIEKLRTENSELRDKIKYASNPKNSGAAVSRNNALQRADGRWIAFLDSDDLWETTKLEKQIEFMVKNGYHFSYTGYQEIDDKSHVTGIRISGPKHVNKFLMYAFCWPGCLTAMYERKHVGLLQIEDIKKNNDYAMWLKVIHKADCYMLDECLAKYRRGRVGSVSTHGYETMIKWHYKLWHEAEDKNVLSSFFLTFLNLFFGAFKKFFYVKRNRSL